MWVRTEDGGAVNLEHSTQLIVEYESPDQWRVGAYTIVGGFGRLTPTFEREEEARQYVSRIIEENNHPPRVVQLGAQHDKDDETGPGARAPE